MDALTLSRLLCVTRAAIYYLSLPSSKGLGVTFFLADVPLTLNASMLRHP